MFVDDSSMLARSQDIGAVQENFPSDFVPIHCKSSIASPSSFNNYLLALDAPPPFFPNNEPTAHYDAAVHKPPLSSQQSKQ